MPKGSPSQADIHLADQLTATGRLLRGQPIRPGQIQSWRKRGLLGPIETAHTGRRGRSSRYQDDALTLAGRVAVLLEEHRDLDAATLTMFGTGRVTPTEPALRRAYDNWATALEKDLGRAQRALDSDAALTDLTARVTAQMRGIFGTDFFRHWQQDIRDTSRSRNIDPVTGRVVRETPRQIKQRRIAEMASVTEDPGSTAVDFLEAGGLLRLLVRQLAGGNTSLAEKAFASIPGALRSITVRPDHHSYESLINIRDVLVAWPLESVLSALPLAMLGEQAQCTTCMAQLRAILVPFAPPRTNPLPVPNRGELDREIAGLNLPALFNPTEQRCPPR